MSIKSKKNINAPDIQPEDTFFGIEDDILGEQSTDTAAEEPASKPTSKKKQADEKKEDVNQDHNNNDDAYDENEFFSYESSQEQHKHPEAKTKEDKRKSRLSIIGGPGSGKTTYIYALGKQVRSTEKIKGWKTGYLTEEYNDFFSKAHIDTKNDWQRTKSGSMKILDMFPMKKGFTRIMVSTFDAAGEDYVNALMESKSGIAYQSSNLHALQKEIIHSKGYLFLIDLDLFTYQYKRENIYKADIPPHDILHNLKQLIINNSSRSNSIIWKRKKIKKPIAFVLTKADLIVDQLEHFGKVKRDGEKVDNQKLQGEAERFIKKNFSVLYQFAKDFKNKSFYAISALGEEPDYYITPDPNQPDKIEIIDRETALKMKEVKVKIKVDVPPVCIEEPLIDILDQIHKTKNNKRNFKISLFLSGVILFIIAYLFLADGFIWIGSKTYPAISKLCYQVSNQLISTYPSFFNKRTQNKLNHQLYDLAQKYYQQGDYNNAYSCLKSYVDQNDKNAQIHPLKIFKLFINISVGFMDELQHNSAIECLQKAYHLDIENKHARLNANKELEQKLYRLTKNLKLEEKIQFIKTGYEIVDTFPRIKKSIVVDAFGKIKASLKNGQPEACLNFLNENQWMHKESQYNTYLSHAKKAKDMVFFPLTSGVEAFYLDPYEVTNKQYKKMMITHKELKPKYWGTNRYKRHSPSSDCPVIYISQKKALRYAGLIGKRLPSTREFQRAWGKMLYPWGNTSKDQVNKYSNTRESGNMKAISVFSELNQRDRVFDKNVYGLCGNVSEFTNDTVINDKNVLMVLIKGGCFNYKNCRPTYIETGRDVKTLVRKAITTTTKMNNVGFRCAMNTLP